MAEHTPAPWWYADGKIGVGAHPDHGYIARLNTWPLRPDEQRANGHLLAAAPDLYAALERFADIDGEGTEDYPDSEPVVITCGRCTHYAVTLGDLRRAAEAHAKAEGR